MSYTADLSKAARPAGPRRSQTPDLDFDSCYLAVSARDGRFDGRFYTAVTSTGIYCRPICPARTPARKNVRFYRHAASAEAAGFRPCRRCRPELSPGAPGWDIRADLVGRALRLIDDGVADERGVAGLAQRLHVTERHLHRLFIAEVGTGPLAVARTRRLLLAKQLLTETSMPITEVAFAAGFGSVRQFNAAMKESYRFAPGDLRKAVGPLAPSQAVQGVSTMGGSSTGTLITGSSSTDTSGTGGTSTGTSNTGDLSTESAAAVGVIHGLTLRLNYRPPYDAQTLLRFLASRAIPGIETVAWAPPKDKLESETKSKGLGMDGDMARGKGVGAGLDDAAGQPAAVSYSRAIPGGSITLVPAEDHIRLTVRTDDTRRLAHIVARCRRLLDLDADPEAIADVLGSTSLGPLVERHPGLRVPGTFDGFELVVRAIVGQQISVAGARTILGRIAARAGTALSGGPEPPPAAGLAPLADVGRGTGVLFPTAEQLAEADLTGLGLTQRRIDTMKIVAQAVATGDIDLDGAADPTETGDSLLKIPGIGPWTVGYIALRALRDPDAWPEGDLALKKAMERLAIPPDQVVRWRPWRSYAALHLWNA